MPKHYHCIFLFRGGMHWGSYEQFVSKSLFFHDICRQTYPNDHRNDNKASNSISLFQPLARIQLRVSSGSVYPYQCFLNILKNFGIHLFFFPLSDLPSVHIAREFSCLARNSWINNLFQKNSLLQCSEHGWVFWWGRFGFKCLLIIHMQQCVPPFEQWFSHL